MQIARDEEVSLGGASRALPLVVDGGIRLICAGFLGGGFLAGRHGPSGSMTIGVCSLALDLIYLIE